MSGHSKWHNIRLKKGKADAARGKVFTKISKEIMLAVREGGPDPDMNYRLSAVIDKAKSNNMPNANIDRAIKKGAGEDEAGSIEEIILEGYGPHGIAILVEAATDNKNRTIPEIRSLFGKYGGSLGEAGCVSWMFDRKGLITVPAEEAGEEEMFEKALEAGAEDLKKEDDVFHIYTDPTDLMEVRKNLKEQGLKIDSAEFTMIPQNEITLGKSQAESILKLVDSIEDNDDVQKVHANMDIPDEIMAEIS